MAAGAVVAVFGVAACGGQGPEEVAETRSKAAYECGEEGAGVLYDHALPSNREITREQAIAQQRQQGCTPKDRPPTEIVLICEQSDRAVVEVRNPDERVANVYVKTDDGWFFDGDTEPNQACPNT